MLNLHTDFAPYQNAPEIPIVDEDFDNDLSLFDAIAFVGSAEAQDYQLNHLTGAIYEYQTVQ